MADAIKLLQAAIQAVEAGADDLAADFAQRAILELRGSGSQGLPWSTDPKDDRFEEFVRRSAGFLQRFADRPAGEVTEAEARVLAREFFGEQPRVVGPSFYRRGLLELASRPTGRVVRLTKKGYSTLKEAVRLASELERTASVY